MIALSIIKTIGILNIAGVALAGVIGRDAQSCDPEPPVVANGSSVAAQLINNATSLFAWQLTTTTQYVGSDADASTLAVVVKDIRDNAQPYLDRLNAIGMNAAVLNEMITGRFGCGINQDTENNVNHIVTYARQVFQTELNTVFTDTKQAFTVLCDNWDYSRLQTIYQTKEQADAISKWVCSNSASAGPTTSVRSSAIDQTAIDQIVTGVTNIFSWELIAILMDTAKVKTACNQDWTQFAANIQKIGLNPNDVKDQFCSTYNQQSLPNSISNAHIIHDQISSNAALVLVIQFFALSDQRAYHEFLCKTENFSMDGLKSIGVDEASFSNGVKNRCTILGL